MGLPAEAPLGAKAGATGAAKAGLTLFGLLAAVLVAVDPLMVDYGMQPMSDVPAACWLLAAVWFGGIVQRR